MMTLNPNLLQHYLAGNHDDLGPLSETPCLIVNAESVEQISDGEKHRPLPCPVLGIGPLPEHASQLCDVIVQDENDLGAMLNNIKRHPMAATVLVQTLRSVEQASYEDGLLIESLAYATLQAGPEYQPKRLDANQGFGTSSHSGTSQQHTGITIKQSLSP